MVKGRIAVLLGQADEDHQEKFIKGVEKQAFRLGYDVCVFSMYIKYQSTPERDKGDSAIFEIINYSKFDAIIIMSDTIQTPGLNDRLEEEIHNKFSGPVICVDRDSKYFKSFWTDGYKLIYELISHLIEVHNKKDIAFLTGKRWHPHSQRRLEAYRDCMQAHGLTVRNDRIFYGDFWYTSGDGCADALLSYGTDLPEAVACANDCMAIGLADAFEKRGIHVPEDIAITGYGTTSEGRTCPKPLTSAYIPSEYYGKYSAQCVFAMMKGEELPEVEMESQLFIGESCGCSGVDRKDSREVRDSWETADAADNFYSIHNLIQEDMMKETSVKGFFEVVYTNIFQLAGADSFHLFLNEHPDAVGYSDRMLKAISYHSDVDNQDEISISDFMDRGLMLEDLYEQRLQPKGYIFTPIFFEDKVHGYAVIGYGNEPRSYDTEYRLWINAVARGFETVIRNIELMQLKSILSNNNVNVSGQRFGGLDLSANGGLTEEEMQEMDMVEKILDDNSLVYYFQPIVDTIDGSIFAYEALMRSGIPKLSPIKILKYAETSGRLEDVEKYTFINVLKIIDGEADVFTGRKVFINSIPGIKLQDEDMVMINDGIAKNHDKIVVEITESSEMEDEDFSRFRRFTRDNGVGIAIDDYGTGYSNISNLLRYMPEYVKIDRALISNVQNDMNKQHFMREIIKFCHDCNIKALAEGVETSEELSTVMSLGVDLIQGYYTARPNPEIIDAIPTQIRNEIIHNRMEYEDKNAKSVYISGRAGRINLGALIKENYNSIEIHGENVTYKDLVIAGSPGLKNEISINVVDGYSGTLTFENISLLSIKNMPCLSIGRDVDVTVILKGDNSFRGGGILVPKSSKLTIRGEGNLTINISASNYYGIGNTVNNECGDIYFHQDGEIKINAKGREGIGIGAGMGGGIHVCRGKYEINLAGEVGIGIGTMNTDAELLFDFCDMSVDVSSTKSVCVGSLNGNVNITLSRSSYNFVAGGTEAVICGTLRGKTAVIDMSEGSMTSSLNAEKSTVVGALNGNTVFNMHRAKFVADSSGKNALVFGGFSDENKISIRNADVMTNLVSETGRDTFATEENFELVNGRPQFKINGFAFERTNTIRPDEI
ncbi:MAG: EAL domain-containing protein [Eubacterium sp.]|nr:EAL domain-containing protein [Eubacterium sp.]